jgi:hypothetical protein
MTKPGDPRNDRGIIFVTGVSGSGKSAVRAELLRRGLAAVGTDEERICAFHEVATGCVVVPEHGEWRTPEWQAAHTWRMVADRVEQVAESAREKPVFLCGTASNEYDFWHLYSEAFSLCVDEDTLRQRVASRDDHDFGQLPHQLAAILSWREAKQECDLQRGAIRIDATRPLSAVVDEILERF